MAGILAPIDGAAHVPACHERQRPQPGCRLLVVIRAPPGGADSTDRRHDRDEQKMQAITAITDAMPSSG